MSLLPKGQLCGLIESIPERFANDQALITNKAVLDFSYLDCNLQGYVWNFPSTNSESIGVTYGIFDSRIKKNHPIPDLKKIFRQALQDHNAYINIRNWKSHPVRWFYPTTFFSIPRVLLVGDAAGVDPLGGEGISFALQYGAV